MSRTPPPSVAAPSISAETQWLQTVVKPKASSTTISSSLPPPPPPPTAQSTQFSIVPFKEDQPPPPVPPILHTRTTDNVKTTTPKPSAEVRPSFQQTPSQLAAQRRMEIMQKELDEVIGMMNLKFDEECIISPDRRLEEFYSNHCPHYNTDWKCGGKQEKDDADHRRKRKTFGVQVCILLGLVLIISSFACGDYVLSNWLIKNEAQQELVEATLRKQKLSSQMLETTPAPAENPPPDAPVIESTFKNKVKSTTVTPVTKKAKEETVTAAPEEPIIIQSDKQSDTDDLWKMFEKHDTLDQDGWEDDENILDDNNETDEDPEIFASNID